MVLLLPGANQLFHRQPVKYFIPFPQKQTMPHPAHASISVCKWMDKFKLAMEDCAADQGGISEDLYQSNRS